VDVSFTLSGESDSGLSFGAKVDLDEHDKGTGNSLDDEFNNMGVAIFVSGSFGKLTLGDTDSAIDWALQEADLGNPGSIADDETAHFGFNDNYELDEIGGLLAVFAFDNQRLRYDYSAGNFGVAVSYEQAPSGAAGEVLPGDLDGTLSVGAKYALDLGGTTVNLGAGYATTDLGVLGDFDVWGISADAAFGGGFKAGIVYSAWDIAGTDATHTGVGIAYETGPIALHANYGIYDVDGGLEQDGFGLAAAYDLGGGLKAHLGYGSGEDFGGAEADSWSLGMSMSF
jgi:outer membrane protein OmpU